MTPEELVADRKAVVKMVNRVRKHLGLGSTSRLSRGVQLHPRACPVAMSLKGTIVFGASYAGLVCKGRESRAEINGLLDDDEKATMRRFLKNVDIERYPELLIPLSEVKVNGQVVV